MVAKLIISCAFCAYLSAVACYGAEAEDLVPQVIRLMNSSSPSDRIAGASGLPDALRLGGIRQLGPYYERMLSDKESAVVAEVLMAIKRTPAKVNVNGPLEDTTALLISLRPRLKELVKSSDARVAFLAREARQSIDDREREFEKQRSKDRQRRK